MLAIEQPLSELETHEHTISWQAWIVCIVAALFFFYEFIQMNMLNAISRELMTDFALNATQLGKLSAYYFYANLIFLFPAGLILDRFSTRKIILTSMLICVLGTWAFSLSTNIHLAATFRFFTGIGSAFCFLSCIRLASRWFPTRRMALITGLIVTMAMLGGTVAQTPFTLLADHFGWRHAVMLDAGLGILILAAIWLSVQDYPPHLPANFAEKNKQAISGIGFWSSLQQSYLNKQNWLCGIYTSTMNLPVCLLGALWGSIFLEKVHQLDPTRASLVTSMIFIGTIIGSPTAGWISDRLALRRLPMLLGTLVSLVIVAFILYVPNLSFGLLILLFLLLGLITSSQIISYPTVAESNSKLLTASSVSVVSFITISGYPISQTLFGWLMDLHRDGATLNGQPVYTAADFHSAIYIMPIGLLIGLAATLLIRETYGKAVG